jgi:signal transduction histidine kinase
LRNHHTWLDVIDNGSGFEPQAVTRSGFGIIGMRERARSIGAELLIDSEPGRGTTVRVVLGD